MRRLLGETEVCIIGGGVMGCNAGLELRERGVATWLLERSPGGPEASSANAGTLAVQNKPLAAIPATLVALERWQQMSDRVGLDVEYERRGGFRVAHTEEDAAALSSAVAAQRAAGAPVELLSASELRREAPYLAPGVRAGSYCPLDGMANPLATHRGLLLACERTGVRVERGVEVTGLVPTGGRGFVVETRSGDVRAQKVLAAAGAWNGTLASWLGHDLGLSAEVLQASITAAAPPLFGQIVTHVRGHLTLKQQATTGKVLIGGGWKGAGELESGTRRLLRSNLRGNLRVAVETIPALGSVQLLRSWVAFEGRSPDRLLVAGPVGDDGFHVVGNASGGFTFCSVAGWLAAAHITGASVGAEWRLFDARRLTAGTRLPSTEEAK